MAEKFSMPHFPLYMGGDEKGPNITDINTGEVHSHSLCAGGNH